MIISGGVVGSAMFSYLLRKFDNSLNNNNTLGNTIIIFPTGLAPFENMTC